MRLSVQVGKVMSFTNTFTTVAQVANVQMCFYDLYALPVAVFLLCRHGSFGQSFVHFFNPRCVAHPWWIQLMQQHPSHNTKSSARKEQAGKVCNVFLINQSKLRRKQRNNQTNKQTNKPNKQTKQLPPSAKIVCF